jgi:predicted RNase H-like HicB family nuclease
MNPSQPDPSSLVHVELNVGNPTYLNLAEMLYGQDAEQWWKELGDFLYGRPGWYCEFTNSPGEPMLWSFGPAGSSLFNITLDDEPGYALFDYEADSTQRFSTVDELGEWLYANEGRHADHTRKLRDLAAAHEWATLKNVGFDVHVIFDNDTWIATVRGLPVVMSAATSLAGAVSNAREAIAHAYDAPRSVAEAIQVQVHLDRAAAAALSS